jgi:hypothetical protein
MTSRVSRMLRQGVVSRPAPILLIAIVILICSLRAPLSSEPPLGYFEGSADVGQPAIAGSTTYDAQAQTYAIAGAGANMWAARDEFHLISLS